MVDYQGNQHKALSIDIFYQTKQGSTQQGKDEAGKFKNVPR